MRISPHSWRRWLYLLGILLGLVGFLLPQPFAAEATFPAAQRLREFLHPDGTLNLPDGYRGSIDARGWQLVSGPNEAPRFAPLSADDHWDDRFAPPVQLDGVVYALAVDGSGNLYAGGQFTTAGGVAANYIARWDGSAWYALGSGMDGFVEALAVDGNGDLYAGGEFTTAGGVAANYIARWDGSAWYALGSGMNFFVFALAVDGSGNLYAGGGFTRAGGVAAYFIARWDGSAWYALGSGMNDEVWALAVDGDGNLYAGGYFTQAGGVAANYIARWDGTVWAPLGSGMNAMVLALAVDGSGNLYAGGSFTQAGGVTANYIARWDGTVWEALGSGMNDEVWALAVDGDGNLYAGGFFTTAGGVAANCIARWDGSAWYALGSGMDGIVEALAVDGSGNLYAGGGFTQAGGTPANYIARWDGLGWEALGNGMNARVRALAVDGSGNLYAGGYFTTAGGVAANYIARWDGSAWYALGSGMNYAVYALAVDGSGNLYAGGDFTTAGGVAANYIARWDGSAWYALGGGMNAGVCALSVDGSGNLYAGGYFTQAGGTPASHIARWDGTAWAALSSGMDDDVYALAVDSSGNLYAGGQFTTAGGVPANCIARWDGWNWSALGSGMNHIVSVLAVDSSGRLYAGGDFTQAGGVPANYIARWDGLGWEALGSGMDGYGVYALALDGSGDLYAGGQFTMAGGVEANYIARWDGSAWYALGSGMDGFVNALVVDGSGDLYAGGDYTTAGNKPSRYMARWFNTAPVAHPDGYTTLEDVVLDVPAPGVLANDTDAQGDTLTAALETPPLVGALTLNADGAFHYTPTLNYFGLVTFTYGIADGYGGAGMSTVAITVTSVDDAPVAVHDAYSATEDTLLVVTASGVLANDSDVENDPLTATLVVGPAHGAAVVNPDGTFSYLPAPDWNGVDTFAYAASDGVLSDTAEVAIAVAPVNDAPVAADDTYTASEDVLRVVFAPGVLGNDGDVDGDALTAALLAPPLSGTLLFNADGSFAYTPMADWNGRDWFTYLLDDGALTDTATAWLVVLPVNDAPTAAADSYATSEDTPLAVPAPGVLANDGDVDGDPLTALLLMPPLNGTAELHLDGSLIYTPSAGFAGADVFTYLLSDGALTDTALVVIDVGAGNDAPIAQDDAYATDEDTPLVVAAPGVLANDLDPEGAPLTAMLVTPPADGTLVLNADGSFTYTPELNWNGTMLFLYLVSDGELTATAAVQLTVNAINDAPVAVGEAYTATAGAPLVIAAPGVLGNDSDVENDPLTAVLHAPPADGELALYLDGSFVYTAAIGFSGVVTFTYQAGDGIALSEPALVTITVRPAAGWAVYLPVLCKGSGR